MRRRRKAAAANPMAAAATAAAAAGPDVTVQVSSGQAADQLSEHKKISSLQLISSLSLRKEQSDRQDFSLEWSQFSKNFEEVKYILFPSSFHDLYAWLVKKNPEPFNKRNQRCNSDAASFQDFILKSVKTDLLCE